MPALKRNKKFNSLISTGLGRLHLVQSAQALSEAGVDVEVVQGWIPKIIPDFIISLGGRLIGSKHLLSGLKKRKLTFLTNQQSYSTAWPEFLAQSLFLLTKLRVLKRGTAAWLAWQAFGYSSKQYINNQDIFHVRSGAGQGGAIKRAKTRGCRIIVDHSIAHPALMDRALRDDFTQFGLSFWLSPDDIFWRSILKDCTEADLLLVNSDFVKESFVDEGFPADSIFVVYLGVRSDFYALKTNYDISGEVNLLFTGGFGIRKGAQYLLPALEQLKNQGINFRMSVVGTSDEAKSIINNSNIKNKLNLTGFIPQEKLKSYLATSDIYIFPSLAEGCASSGMEAMAAGLPVIATRESGLPIQHGKNGWLIPSKSSEDIAKAIKLLVDDKKLREAIGREAARTIAENYTWEDYANNVSDVYSFLLDENDLN